MARIPQQTFPSLYTPQQSWVICGGTAGVDSMNIVFNNQEII